MNEVTSSPPRTMTVTFKVPETLSKSPPKPMRTSSEVSRRSLRSAASVPMTTTAKTADLSHITDHPTMNPGVSFIPPEDAFEVETPTPLRPGTGVLMSDNRTWKTQIFPSTDISATSREEAENLGEWLNRRLAENQKTAKDPLELASNARHYFTIAYQELCREVSCDCPERAVLLNSIWKRYQALFQRVTQLHQEEKAYLMKCHKERTANMRAELDATQVKLKAMSKKYRDDQERWSSAREREETKFANLRKKLDLQIKNKRALLQQIKVLKDKIEGKESAPEKVDEKTEEKDEEVSETPSLTSQALSDRVHLMRQRVKKHFPGYYDVSATLDDIAHMVDQERGPARSTKELFPCFFHKLASNYSGKVRSMEWVMSALTHFYTKRISTLSHRRRVFPYQENRQHFVLDIYGQMLAVFGMPERATSVLFDLIETARGLSKVGNKRCKLFLRFIDAEEPWLDSIYLDFYCFCLGSLAVSNITSLHLFPDEFGEEVTTFAPLTGSMALEFAKKVLFTICENDAMERYVEELKSKYEITDESTVCQDDILEFLLEVYEKEEKHAIDQMKEQYHMDAAQYGGVLSSGQFQTLVQFSARKLDWRCYPGMMREALQRTGAKTISFQDLMAAMHKYAMLVPFNFDRVEFDYQDRFDDTAGFLKSEYDMQKGLIANLLEQTKAEDEAQYQQLVAAKAKFEQALETRQKGYYSEVAIRELFELLHAIIHN